MAATPTKYLDPDGIEQTGYIIDGKTYTDAQGTNRVGVGSVVTTAGGTYKLTENGGVLVPDNAGQTTPAAADTTTAATVATPDMGSAAATPAETETTAASNYTPLGTYNDAALSAEDKKTVEALQDQWQIEMQNGNVEAANELHRQAEEIRAGYDYSGGVDGSQYIPVNQTSGSTTGTPQSQISDAQKYIYDMYDNYTQAQKQALAAAYEQNVNTLNAAAEKIPAQYQTARNQAASQSQVQRANFNEYAAASGLNSGAGGQASLAMGNQLQSSLSGISQAEADALADLELQRTQLATQYKNDIAQSIADGELQKAQALYENYIRQDEKLTQQQQFDATMSANQNQFDATMAYNNGNTDFDRAVYLYQLTKNPSYLSKWLTPEEIESLSSQ